MRSACIPLEKKEIEVYAKQICIHLRAYSRGIFGVTRGKCVDNKKLKTGTEILTRLDEIFDKIHNKPQKTNDQQWICGKMKKFQGKISVISV